MYEGAVVPEGRKR